MTSGDHDELREQTGLYVLGALTPADRVAFDAHVAVCSECACEVSGLRRVLIALARSVPEAVPSPDVRRRLVARFPEGTATAGFWWRAAAAVALATGLAVYSTLHDRDWARSQIAVMTAPDLVHVAMAGQPPAPGASAHVLWSRSHGLVVTAFHLPPLPPRRVYQLWILTGRTAPISHGWLLEPDASGNAAVRFDTAPDLPAPLALAVTIEPAGGSQAPSGAKYLVGAVAGG